MNNLLGKFIAGTFVVVAIGLALTKPSGVATDLGAGASAYATGVKALELR